MHVLYYPFQVATAHIMKGTTGFAVYLLYTLLREPLITSHRSFSQVLDLLSILCTRWNNVRQCKAASLLNVLNKVFEMITDLLLIVDALDECSSSDVPLLLEYLAERGKRPCTRIILIARDHLLSQDDLQRFVHIPVDLECVKKDIVLFVDQEIGSSRRLEMLKDEPASWNILRAYSCRPD
jgi:hypothetical protein